jgi:hypothetical protein
VITPQLRKSQAMIRSFSELSRIDSFLERFRYLSLPGNVGEATFGSERWLNQEFYRSFEWKTARRDTIARDYGCDLGVEGHEIHRNVLVHHMNPIVVDQIRHGDLSILDPEFLITVSHNTHNAIHYGSENLIPSRYVARSSGDTKLW